ncbi:metal-dependent hydrolase [Thermococcus sp. SY098]|uniref:metal-dependent hydrolase n=1 Tax=Thermococcus sp. SY098 TaxID=3111325 RepID=UPI002D78557C|nr:metal-dependent hydrolase [Thermococcus sp. SY098]WRS53079.1 metal-dependent hydrolase [Thermococcus sp. SY098]
MDPLKHASIPLLAFLAISKSPSLASVAVLVFGAIFPDFDVLFEEHRGYFHSLLFIIPIFCAFVLHPKPLPLAVCLWA